MTKDEINEEACEHCNQVMCSVIDDIVWRKEIVFPEEEENGIN